ncbi:hypothetical protein DL89DRAFT_109748 [Linderina pennispora]|uniref:Uncharacterized protein n=1 Tax=Linderina pennispora TaxID=61395 RepID=A0A1Y1WGB8_9FUNG|nr:uncharacterized protein DL89DRAFT_109748 [Linderina pennispora]ORX72184.1 hypothetical protein DL89DRAFT_109748 [Linderina pennispora]
MANRLCGITGMAVQADPRSCTSSKGTIASTTDRRHQAGTTTTSSYGHQQHASSQHQSTGGYSAYGGSHESRSLSPGSSTMMDSVDRVASDLNHAIQISQPGGSGRISTPDNRTARAQTNASTTSSTSMSDADKLRNEYEMRLAAMRKRIGQLGEPDARLPHERLARQQSRRGQQSGEAEPRADTKE